MHLLPRLVSFAPVALMALALSGCGGGGGGARDGDGGGGMLLMDKWQRFADGNPTLALSQSETIALHNKVAGRVTHGIDGAYYHVDPESGKWTRDYLVDGLAYEVDSDPITAPFPEGSSFEPVLEHNGVTLFNVRHDLTSEYDGLGTLRSIRESYDGYLEYSAFWVGRSVDCVESSFGTCSESSLGESSMLELSADSEGQFTRANPPGMGSASWTGVMSGVDVKRFEPGTTRWVFGDARIDIDDLSSPDVDVSFTGIRDVKAGTALPDMEWNGLSLADGAFNDGSSRTISGMFYGPAQQEVGGVFDRDGITGAFGAKRR